MKNILIAIFLIVSFLESAVTCYTFSCDGTIKYTIGRYSDKTIQRLSDYKKTITYSRKAEETYRKILKAQESRLDKIITRLTLENIKNKNILHFIKRQKYISKRYNSKDK